MQSLMKINGTWKEGTPYLKESGTWKECNVTAKANGKWADIAPPKPAGKHWTIADFEEGGGMGAISRYGISLQNPQYFSVGDTMDIESPLSGKIISGIQAPAGIPQGLSLQNGHLVGTINGPPSNPNIKILLNLKEGRPNKLLLTTNSGDAIPVKPAP